MQAQQWTKEEIIHCLQWHIDLGCDDIFDETPLNRFQEVIREASTEASPSAETILPSPTRATDTPKNERRDQVDAPRAPLVFAQSAQKITLPNLAEVHTLEALKQILTEFEGSSLKKMAKNTVFSDGVAHSRVMVIGEAPGREEDRQGLPFIGPSGQLLDKMLASIGLNRQSVYIANLIPWRPPGDRTPTQEEIDLFLPILKRHIELASPEILLAVGGTAAKALLNTTTGITKLRGNWQTFATEKGEIPVLPLFHPAFLLRTPSRKAEAWADLCALRARLDRQAEKPS